eukprot:444273_1
MKSPIATLLVVLPVCGCVFVFIATYGSGWLDGRSIQDIHTDFISHLGLPVEMDGNAFRWLFTTGFILASCVITSVAICKHYLMTKLWKYPLFNTLLLIFGCINLSLMAIFPAIAVHWYGAVHEITAVVAIICFVTWQITDEVNWMQYMRHRKKQFKLHDYVFAVYGFTLPILSFLLFGLWVFMPRNSTCEVNQAVYCEWLGFDALIMGFITQSIHGIYIYRFVL